jgi:hypothetical protein
MSKIKLLTVPVLATVFFGQFSTSKADVTVYNYTDQPINVLVDLTIGSAKLKDIEPNSSKIAKTKHNVNPNKINAYYVDDKDFKYPFLSSEPKHWLDLAIQKIGGPLSTYLSQLPIADIGIYPTKITATGDVGVYHRNIKTIDLCNNDCKDQGPLFGGKCSLCRTDSKALDKVKTHYKIG